MKRIIFPWIAFALVGTAVLSHPPQAGEAKTPAASPSTTTSSAANADLDRALAEFKASAERLGKSMAQAAENGTAEARLKIMKSMNKAILELSHSMDRAADKIGASKEKKSD